MIDPKDFLSYSDTTQNKNSELIEIDGTFSCPEQGCYEISRQGKFNERERVVTWICSKGHLGRATL